MLLQDLKDGLGVDKKILGRLQTVFETNWGCMKKEEKSIFQRSFREDETHQLEFGWDTWERSCKDEVYLGILRFFIPNINFELNSDRRLIIY